MKKMLAIMLGLMFAATTATMIACGDDAPGPCGACTGDYATYNAACLESMDNCDGDADCIASVTASYELLCPEGDGDDDDSAN